VWVSGLPVDRQRPVAVGIRRDLLVGPAVDDVDDPPILLGRADVGGPDVLREVGLVEEVRPGRGDARVEVYLPVGRDLRALSRADALVRLEDDRVGLLVDRWRVVLADRAGVDRLLRGHTGR
jgi:hypothetical protein